MSVRHLRSTHIRLIPRAISWRRRLWLVLILASMMPPVLYSQTRLSRQEMMIRSHFQRAQAEMASGNSALAERDFRTILALDPNNSEAHAKLGFVLFLREDWAGAAGNLQQVLKAQPHLANVQAVLGMCEDRLGRPAEARALLQQAFPHLAPGALKTRTGLELAELLYQTDDLNRVVDIVRTLLPANPKNADVLYTAARTYADLANRFRDGLALAAPNSGRMHQLMAEFLINRGDTHAAIIEYRKALELAPALADVHFELGEAILLDSHEPSALAAAEKQFRAALAENPSDGSAEYCLGTIYSLRRDYKTAIEYYSRALRLEPDNARAQQELGWAWFRLGEPKKALKHLLTATQLDPLLPTAHYQLGMLYRKLGRAGDSRRELADFEKLQASQKQIDQVYLRTRPGSPQAALTRSSAPEN
jgi:tetratricopeptide (TPR) repeat protein